MLQIRDPQVGSRELEFVQRAIEAGSLVVVPTDTVYGIAARAADEAACRRLYEVKGRALDQPTAVVFATLRDLAAMLPRTSERARLACRALLPGPVTLLIANHDGAVPWLCGETPGVIGVRVPEGQLALPPLAATSANEPGEPEAATVRDLPASIAGEIACAVDRGELPPGNASTVLDLTTWETTGDVADVLVLRDPAGRSEALIAALPA